MQYVDVVLYHNKCYDGYMANVIACHSYHEASNQHMRPLVTKGVYPGPGLLDSLKELMVQLHNSNMSPYSIISFDVSMGPDEYAYLCKQTGTVSIHDHHRTTADIWLKTGEPIPKEWSTTVFYDEILSGCELAWRYYYPEKPAPIIVKAIGDRDTWREDFTTNKDGTHYISEGFYNTYTPGTKENDLQDWMEALAFSRDDIANLSELGQTLLKIKADRMAAVRKQGTNRLIKLGEENYTVFVINATWDHSDLGNLLAPNVDFVAIWGYNAGRRTYKFSLRSAEDKTDVSKIAALFGGGGHVHAAGFETQDISPWL